MTQRKSATARPPRAHPEPHLPCSARARVIYRKLDSLPLVSKRPGARRSPRTLQADSRSSVAALLNPPSLLEWCVRKWNRASSKRVYTDPLWSRLIPRSSRSASLKRISLQTQRIIYIYIYTYTERKRVGEIKFLFSRAVRKEVIVHRYQLLQFRSRTRARALALSNGATINSA